MRTNVRIGNDIKLLWEVLRGGQPVNLNDATYMAVSIMQGGVLDCNEATPITTFAVDPTQNNLLVVEIQADKITELGYLWVKLEYTMPDGGMIDGNRKITIDNLPVKIVGLTDEAGDVYEFNVTTDVVVGFDGKSAYEVWLVENPDKTLQDYFDWVQQPATDIATEVSQAEALRVQAESLRVQAENIRIANEQERVTAEQGRTDAEGIRASSEVDRVNAENVRLANEQDRIDAEALRDGAEQQRLIDEATRVSNEQTRVLNEGERVTAEQGRVDAEIIREQQETDRQTNTATAIADAEEATTNANDAAEAANNAAATIDAKIATKAEQADLLQLEDDAEFKANKQNSLTPDGTGVKYPTVDAVNAALSSKAEQADFLQLAGDVEGTIEMPIAHALSQLKEEIDSLRILIEEGRINRMQIETLDVISEIRINGSPLIYVRDSAPSFSPDQVPQFYIDTSAGRLYTAKGAGSANDWF